jgi:hypothetical protein
MTSRAPRLYATALALLVFFVLWAAVSARPWAAAAPADPRLAALERREAALRAQAALVERRLRAEWAAYGRAVAARPAPAAPAPAPAVSIAALPPATSTRSS